MYTGEICNISVIEDADQISITVKLDDLVEKELLNSYFSAFLLLEEINLLKKLLVFCLINICIIWIEICLIRYNSS